MFTFVKKTPAERKAYCGKCEIVLDERRDAEIDRLRRVIKQEREDYRNRKKTISLLARKGYYAYEDYDYRYSIEITLASLDDYRVFRQRTGIVFSEPSKQLAESYHWGHCGADCPDDTIDWVKVTLHPVDENIKMTVSYMAPLTPDCKCQVTTEKIPARTYKTLVCDAS